MSAHHCHGPDLLFHEYLLVLQVRLLSRHTGHTIEEVDKEINRPRYFEPYEAVEWGIIDKVGELPERAPANLV